MLAGLADQALLNTKPMSRMEAARIVAQAVRRIELDQSNDYSNRGHIEDLLYKLIKEFSNELAEMGVRTPLNKEGQSGFLGLSPLTTFNLEALLPIIHKNRYQSWKTF